MSRLYGSKFYNRSLEKRFRVHAESRDAIVWDLDDTNKLVRCKIQNSNEYILCHYPRNYQTLPPWCKRGNAVRIAHKGGIRGYYEVEGHGRAIPSPIAEAEQQPPAQDLYEGVVTGGNVTPWTGAPMGLTIGATTYRIDGVDYTLNLTGGYAVLGDDVAVLGKMGAASNFSIMGAGNVNITLDPAPSSPNVRYDLLVVGTDENLDIVKGTASTNPVMPAVPADHIKIAHVMVLGGMTEISDFHINGIFETRHLHAIVWTPSSGTGTITAGEFVWHPSMDYPDCNVNVTFKCQYGWTLSLASSVLTLVLVHGIGRIYSGDTGWHASTVTQAITTTNGYTFKYERDQLGTEYSPVFQLDFSNEIVTSAYRLQLLASGGGGIP
jgi:hypothetical protein